MGEASPTIRLESNERMQTETRYLETNHVKDELATMGTARGSYAVDRVPNRVTFSTVIR